MPAPKGNQFWKARATHGRDKLFTDPEILKESCIEYVDWVEAHPLYASEVVKFQGKATLKDVPKMRAMTIGGLCIFLGIDTQTWANYKADKDFFGIIHEVETIIKTQKFEGASADLLNANIIARDLGLTDKTDIKARVDTHELTEKEIDAENKQMLTDNPELLKELGWVKKGE